MLKLQHWTQQLKQKLLRQLTWQPVWQPLRWMHLSALMLLKNLLTAVSAKEHCEEIGVVLRLQQKQKAAVQSCSDFWFVERETHLCYLTKQRYRFSPT